MVPLELDESDGPSWTIAARGRTFTPPRRTTLSPFTVAHRSTIYSPQRILTPLKRSTSTPRASATRTTAGSPATSPSAGTRRSTSSPARSSGSTASAARRPCSPRRAPTTCGASTATAPAPTTGSWTWSGFTYGEHNPDSWEGWHWGGMHMWGFSHRLGIPEQYDLLEDALQNTELIVFWSSDPETTGGGIYTAFESTPRRYWFKELGVKMVFIDPYFNHTAELFGDKWFAPRLGTDVAMGLAIAFTWLDRGPLRQGVRGVAHRRLRRVDATTCSAGPTTCPRPRSGPRASAASPPARSARSRASGAARRRCSPPAARAGSAAPAARPPATSGRAP